MYICIMHFSMFSTCESVYSIWGRYVNIQLNPFISLKPFSNWGLRLSLSFGHISLFFQNVTGIVKQAFGPSSWVNTRDLTTKKTFQIPWQTTTCILRFYVTGTSELSPSLSPQFENVHRLMWDTGGFHRLFILSQSLDPKSNWFLLELRHTSGGSWWNSVHKFFCAVANRQSTVWA